VLRAVDHLWRLAGTGIAFVLLFVGGGLLAVTAFPVVELTTRSAVRRRERNQYLIHIFFRAYVAMLQYWRLIDLRIEGKRKLHESAACLIIANHPSLLDVVLLMALIRRAQCVVKRELWESFFLGRLVRGAGYIRNDLALDATLEACRTALANGHSIIIFPEGTRTLPSQRPHLRRGFANIAIMLAAQIQLVTITCVPPTLVKGEKWWIIPSRRPTFRVVVGDRLDAKAWLACKYRSQAARKLLRHVEHYYAEQLANG
jgi:1-acyl-sn-glycerol-3-phosphate acyltransferase